VEGLLGCDVPVLLAQEARGGLLIGVATSRPWMGWGSNGASLTGFSRTTHAWDRLSAGTPTHAVTAVTSAMIRIRIARAVTAVIIAPAVTTVTRRAFITRPGGIGPPFEP
jgi:hypothetical protein